MKLSKKSSKSSLFSGRKGKIVIQKTNLSQRKAIANFTVRLTVNTHPRAGIFSPTLLILLLIYICFCFQ